MVFAAAGVWLSNSTRYGSMVAFHGSHAFRSKAFCAGGVECDAGGVRAKRGATPYLTTVVLLLASLSGCGEESERALYTSGHADIALSLTTQEGRVRWETFLLTGADGTVDGQRVQGAISLEDVAVESAAYFTRPLDDMGAFEPLCVAEGVAVGWLPQGLRDARDFEAPFLGISAEAEPGVLSEDTVALRLLQVESPSGSGAYSLWRDALPPEFFMSSCDGVGEEDVLHVPLGHDHYNMGFSEIGPWTLTYEASARLADGQTTSHEFQVHYVLE